MLSSNYCVILIVAVISISWSKAASLERNIASYGDLQSNDIDEMSEVESPCPLNEMSNKYKWPEWYCDIDPESDWNYYPPDGPPKCRCADGYRRLSNEECALEEECKAALNCPEDEIPNFDRIWQPTCDSDDDDETLQFEWQQRPVQKCLCPAGKMRKSDGSCVTQSMCGESIHIY